MPNTRRPSKRRLAQQGDQLSLRRGLSVSGGLPMYHQVLNAGDCLFWPTSKGDARSSSLWLGGIADAREKSLRVIQRRYVCRCTKPHLFERFNWMLPPTPMSLDRVALEKGDSGVSAGLGFWLFPFPFPWPPAGRMLTCGVVGLRSPTGFGKSRCGLPDPTVCRNAFPSRSMLGYMPP